MVMVVVPVLMVMVVLCFVVEDRNGNEKWPWGRFVPNAKDNPWRVRVRGRIRVTVWEWAWM